MATTAGVLQVAVCVSMLPLSAALEIVTVDSEAGIFNGYVRTFTAYGVDIKSERFLGIPFAEPPTGELRFKKPKKIARLEHPYDAQSIKPGCLPQNVDFGGVRRIPHGIENSIDCLYLNIYRPHGTKIDGNLPVIISIHGGGFVAGRSDTFPGDVFSVHGDVIVVAMNYRLSLWGFLSTGDKNLPGNLGLWDQHLAIQWVHDNIASFGGDHNAVTILGLSAGSGSVIYHGMFPGNKGLFQRIVAQSGSITCPWAFQPEPLTVAKRLGALVGCNPGMTSEDLTECLTGKSDEELSSVLNDPNNNFVRFPMEFVPNADGEFIPASPKDMFHGSNDEMKKRRMNFADYDLINGLTDGDGLVMLNSITGYHGDADKFTLNREQFEKEVIPKIVRYMFGEASSDLLNDIVIAEYTDWADPNNDMLTREAFLKLNSDHVFNIHALETADLHKSLSDKNTYLYLLAANPSQHYIKSVSWSNKTNHAEDWVYLFGHDEENSWTEPYGKKVEPWEMELSKAFITMFSNFARSGDPNGPKPTAYGTKSTTWPRYDVDQPQCVVIRQNGTSIETNPFARAVNFWKRLLPKVAATVTQGKQGDSLYCDKDGC